MGALTLKSFPFELRGWDIEKFESIDPTDGFGSNTRVYISKDQVILIEPDYDSNTLNTWITDKGRQFFDGLFGTWSAKKIDRAPGKESWVNILRHLTRALYIFNHCSKHQSKNHFFTIVFENISLEILGILTLIAQKYSFIKLKRAESYRLNNDLETDFQLNLATNKLKLNSSTICLLISTNPRYEGYYLNLSLRQRFFKGNFKCLSIGSLLDLTFPISFLGSNVNILKTIAAGNHLMCQDLKFSKNPLLILNNEISKRQDGQNLSKLLKTLKYSGIFNRTWSELNTLAPSLSEAGNQALNLCPPLSLKDLTNFSSLYFLNVTMSTISNVKKITKLKLLSKSNDIETSEKIILDQHNKLNNNLIFTDSLNFSKRDSVNKYFYLPTNTFYENEETFINTEGFLKRTNKLIFKKKSQNNWQILRKLLKHFDKNITFFNTKDKNILFFNSEKITTFKNLINFQFYATQTLTNVNFYLNIKTQKFAFYDKYSKFKMPKSKVISTKMKYWLDDFFTGGKDEYSQNSLILTNCSRILRSHSTNFF